MEASRKTRPEERLGTGTLYGRRNREPEPRQEQVSRKDRVGTWLSPDPGAAATPARSFNRPDLPRHDAGTQAHPALLLSSQALAREPRLAERPLSTARQRERGHPEHEQHERGCPRLSKHRAGEAEARRFRADPLACGRYAKLRSRAAGAGKQYEQAYGSASACRLWRAEGSACSKQIGPQLGPPRDSRRSGNAPICRPNADLRRTLQTCDHPATQRLTASPRNSVSVQLVRGT